MKVAIVGSRNSKNYPVDEVMRHIPFGCTGVISGGAVGIDRLAELAAKKIGIAFIQILPNYQKFGKNAPIMRNREIVEQADRVLAFWDYHSRGTASVIAACIERNVPFEIIGIGENKQEKD